ncbi:MAG TPA: hypothetical protein PLL10_07590, partial [Elusimicrobiales bacterium]|nr:hypothetical protein [Elusimicrobiales bacterium]
TSMAGAESLRGLEAKKAEADARFKEGTQQTGNLLGGAAASNLPNTSEVEPPEAKSDSGASSSSSSSSPSMGGSGNDSECGNAATQFEQATTAMRQGVRDLSAMVEAGKDTEDGLDALCDLNGQGAALSAITKVNDGMQRMSESIQTMKDKSCNSNYISDGWECGVLCKTQEAVAPFVQTIDPMCDNYWTYRKLDQASKDSGGQWAMDDLHHNFNLNKYKDAKEEYDRLHGGSGYTGAVDKLRGINEKVNGTEGTSAEDSLSAMSTSGGTCQYDNMGVGSFSVEDKSDNSPNAKACEDWGKNIQNSVLWGLVGLGALLAIFNPMAGLITWAVGLGLALSLAIWPDWLANAVADNCKANYEAGVDLSTISMPVSNSSSSSSPSDTVSAAGLSEEEYIQQNTFVFQGN